MRHRGIAVAAVVAALALAPPALGDGLPIGNLDAGPGGVESQDGATRYVAVQAGKGMTVLRIRTRDGLVVRSRFLTGHVVVPVVALDGTAGGLSADGSTLVLIRPRLSFPRKTTSFAILRAGSLRVRERFTLRGDFSFDALSPDGAAAYLVQYVSPVDPTRYVVRRYDVDAGRLVPGAVVDPRERTVVMRGYPLTREASPDGRWVYTLYDGAGAVPFIHALDTVGRKAVCIDLPALSGRTDLYEFGLTAGPGGAALTVSDAHGSVALVETRTFAVSAPARVHPGPPGTTRSASTTPSSDGPTWPLPLAGGLATLVAAGALLAGLGLTRRRRMATRSR